MATIVLNYDSKNSLANSIVDSIKKSGAFDVVEEKSPYNKAFVKKIQASRKSKGVVIKTEDLWK
jgi:hypothetical protein